MNDLPVEVVRFVELREIQGACLTDELDVARARYIVIEAER